MVPLAALGLALLAVGLPLLALEGRTMTAELSRRYALSSEAGLSPERMQELAEQVRAFVVLGQGELPRTVDGRAGFDEAASSHLEDVHAVLKGARMTTGLVAALLALWLGAAAKRGHADEIAQAFPLAAAITGVSVGALLTWAVADFDSLFSAFHGVFFSDGTWTFSYDSLLIQLFPEPFWVTAGGLWAVLMGVCVVGYVALGATLRRNTLRNMS